MAKIVFVFKTIKYFLRSEKTLSLLILLGMVMCDTIFLVFGNVFWSDIKSNEYEIYKNNVVTFQFDVLDIEMFLAMTENMDYITSTFFSYTEFVDKDHSVIISAYSPSFDATGERIRLGHALTGTNMECMVNSQYLQRENIVLSGSVIDSEFRFLDTGWNCAGIIVPSMADNFDFLINIEDFKNHINNQVTAGFRYDNGTSLMQVHQFAGLLKEKFHADFMAVPSRTVHVGFVEFLSDMSEMLVLLVIAIVNYMFLYRFILRKRMYIYGIFRLQGMNNCLILMGLFVELLLFLVTAFAFSLLLYFGGIVLLGQMSAVILHGLEFLFSFVIIISINLLFFGLAVIKLVYNSPIKLIKESVVD